MNMRLKFTLLMSLLVVFAAGCAAKLPPAEWAKEPPPGARVSQAPKMKLGDYWEFRVSQSINGQENTADYSKEIVALNPDGAFKLKKTVLKNGAFYFEHYGTRHEFIAYQRQNESRTRGIDLGRYNFPLWVGKRWSQSYSLVGEKGKLKQYANQFIVLEYGPLKVGNKIYQAYKINLYNPKPVYKNHANPQTVIRVKNSADAEAGNRFFWYAPKLKSIVKYVDSEFHYQEELLLFRPRR